MLLVKLATTFQYSEKKRKRILTHHDNIKDWERNKERTNEYWSSQIEEAAEKEQEMIGSLNSHLQQLRRKRDMLENPSKCCIIL